MFQAPQPAISLVGLSKEGTHPWSSSARAAITWAAGVGARGLAIDGTASATRARNLDRSARRDLAAALRRSELAFAGVDLFIPPEHFTDTTHADRAVSATVQAIELSRDLAGTGDATVSLALPIEPPASLVRVLEDEAAGLGVVLADHAPREPGAATPGAGESLRLGIDPAVILREKLDPVEVLTNAGAALAAARLSDASAFSRCPVGAEGSRLDLQAYALAAATVGVEHVVIDLRGIADQHEAAAGTITRWRDSVSLPGL